MRASGTGKRRLAAEIAERAWRRAGAHLYEIEAVRENWSMREFERQIASRLYERLPEYQLYLPTEGEFRDALNREREGSN